MITLSNLVDLNDNYLLEQYGKELTMTATSKYYQKVQGQILFLGSNNMQMDPPFSCKTKRRMFFNQSLLNQTKVACRFDAPMVFSNTNQCH